MHSKSSQNKREKAEQKKGEHDTRALQMMRDRDRERDMKEAKRMAQKYQKPDHEKSLDFLYEPPPGMTKVCVRIARFLEPNIDILQEPEPKPEDIIPDLPENKEVREFLKSAPTKGLWYDSSLLYKL